MITTLEVHIIFGWFDFLILMDCVELLSTLKVHTNYRVLWKFARIFFGSEGMKSSKSFNPINHGSDNKNLQSKNF
jgi:hypothetical protein